MRLAAVLVLCGVAAWAEACANSGPAELIRHDEPDASLDSGLLDAALDVPADQPVGDSSGDTQPDDAATLPVALTLAPTAAPDAGPSGVALGALDSLAAGAAGLRIRRRWSDLFSSASVAREAAWSELASLDAIARTEHRSIAFELVIADRTERSLPDGTCLTWDDPDCAALIAPALARVFTTFGDDLTLLSFGTEVDRHLARLPLAERAPFVDLVTSLVDAARQHPDRPSTTLVGVSLGAEAVSRAAQPESALLALGDVSVVSYLPLDTEFRARAVDDVGGDLTAVDGVVSPGRPIALDVAYPSSDAAGSSPVQQRAFYDALFAFVDGRRSRFVAVGITELDDADETSCVSRAASWGAASEPALVAASCSLGVRGAQPKPKPAWAAVVAAFTTFVSR